MNDEPTVERTDDPAAEATEATQSDQEPGASQTDGKAAGRDLGTFVTAVGDAVQEIARDVAERARPVVRDAATKAGPVVREASARAAEVAAKAADAAGPIAQKVASATGDVGHRVAERSREIATDLRRAAGAPEGTNGHDATGDVPPAELASVDTTGRAPGDAALN
jgi:hypothetical protein